MSEGFRTSTARPLLLWTLWILYVGAWSAALLRPEPAHAAAALLPSDDVRFYILKTVHVLAYLILTVLTGLLQMPRPWRWLLLLFLSAHGMGTEFLQQFVPPREGSWRDVGLDHLGICLGVLLAWKWWFGPSPDVSAIASAGSEAANATEESSRPVAGPPA
jgi:VanZ family protein